MVKKRENGTPSIKMGIKGIQNAINMGKKMENGPPFLKTVEKSMREYIRME